MRAQPNVAGAPAAEEGGQRGRSANLLRYQIDLPGFGNHPPVLVARRWWPGAYLSQDGRFAQSERGRSGVLLQRANGDLVGARLRPRGLLGLDPVPDVEVGGIRCSVTPPLPWYQWVFCALPVLLLVGGATGALLGILALMINARVFRGLPSDARRYVVAGLVSFAASVLCLVIPLLGTVLLSVLS